LQVLAPWRGPKSLPVRPPPRRLPPPRYPPVSLDGTLLTSAALPLLCLSPPRQSFRLRPGSAPGDRSRPAATDTFNVQFRTDVKARSPRHSFRGPAYRPSFHVLSRSSLPNTPPSAVPTLPVPPGASDRAGVRGPWLCAVLRLCRLWELPRT